MRRTVMARRSPYTVCMLRTGTALMMAFTLAACGLKGDLYLPPPEAPAGSVAARAAREWRAARHLPFVNRLKH